MPGAPQNLEFAMRKTRRESQHTVAEVADSERSQQERFMPEGQFKLLYDGECPFCRREVEWLRRRDRDGNLALQDIADPGFDPEQYGLTREEVAGVLHGILPDGRVVRRVEAIRQAYQAVGLGWLVAPTRWPVIRGVLDGMYGIFARNRTRWGRFLGNGCQSGKCAVTSVPPDREPAKPPPNTVGDR
jgi:predicted DCC family thiol-disulfide oxidoreductase YuxK